MRKLILSAAIILTATVGAFAQTTKDQAQANLSVTITPIQTIAVLNPNVNLNYATKEDYDKGVTEKMNDHLQIYSTGAFQVKVVASDLEAPGVTEKIPASGITVLAEEGSSAAAPTANLRKPLPLPTDVAETIFTSPTGGIDKRVNITYKGAGGDAYINKFFKAAGATSNVYSTTVTYCVEAM